MKTFKKIIICILSAAIVVFLFVAVFSIAKNCYEDYRSQKIFDELEPSRPIPSGATAEVQAVSSEMPLETPSPSPAPTPAPEPEKIPNPYAESFQKNSDMVAWISVPDTKIDYPVMWTPDDEQYYLKRGFDKASNKNGCLILDTDSCLDPLTTNLIIHGHNMKSGAMFGELPKYEDYDYYSDHKEIILYTMECEKRYEIIAVFRSQVYKKTDEVFKFYKFFQADTAEEFDDFYHNIKSLSLYDTGVTAEFGDNFITLSTCTYHVENGRFVVVGKEIESGDFYEPIEQSQQTN